MRKIISLFLITIMVFSLAACASPTSVDEETPETPEVVEPEDFSDMDEKEGATTPEDEELEAEEDMKEEEKKEKEVNLYYAVTEYIVTGNEDLTKIKAEKRTVDYKDTILEEAVVKELLTEAKSEGLENAIPSSVKLIDVKVEDDIAYVNFSKEGMNGGSLTESLTINQIVASLLDLGTVNKVQFLLDGEVSESLMGHATITDPIGSVDQ